MASSWLPVLSRQTAASKLEPGNKVAARVRAPSLACDAGGPVKAESGREGERAIHSKVTPKLVETYPWRSDRELRRCPRVPRELSACCPESRSPTELDHVLSMFCQLVQI